LAKEIILKRELFQQLQVWHKDSRRSPLIVRGARQVGKTFLIESFAQAYFPESFIVINFEAQPQFKECFDGELFPEKIVQQIELLTGKECIPGKSLLFFDEIQECPKAILSLRYFKEKLPDLHVIAAGSLLEFALAESQFSFPVGRVAFLYLKPLSFTEFLMALEENKIISFLEEITLSKATEIPPAVHHKLLYYVRLYLLLGGMPQVIREYIESRSVLTARKMQQFLLQSYIYDFGKYATTAQHKYLQRLLQKAPNLVAQQIKYSSIDREMKSRDLKIALQQLNFAGVLSIIYATSAASLPLRAGINEKKFKLLLLDIGLMNQAIGIDEVTILQSDTVSINLGKIAEQFVGQELLAYQDPHQSPELFYWQRDKKDALAEVDFLSAIHNKIIPIEVKSGKTGSLKSLTQILIDYPHIPFGVQICEQSLQFHNNVLIIPFYLIHQLDRIVREALELYSK
jgi:predicted AAA+ superfamily ATPase